MKAHRVVAEEKGWMDLGYVLYSLWMGGKKVKGEKLLLDFGLHING